MAFFDKYSEFLDTSIVGNWPDRLNARYEAIIAANKPLFDGARVLDLASHDGRWSFAALDAGAASVCGVEARPELVAAANSHMESLGISPDRYRFVAGDMFEQKDVFKERFDVILCLGVFYHTTRHVELLHLIRSTNAPTLILDTSLCPLNGNFSYIGIESSEHPANGAETIGVQDGKILVAYPTVGTVQMMLEHFGYTVQEVNWQRVISHLGLTFEKEKGLSSENPIVDYCRRERSTFLATLKR